MATNYEVVALFPEKSVTGEYPTAAEALATAEAMLKAGFEADRLSVFKVDREPVGLVGLRAEVESAERNPKTCEYFALCTNDADGTVTHPVLGQVPTCTRCAEKMEKDLHPFEAVGS